jgi:hypothetical protein
LVEAIFGFLAKPVFAFGGGGVTAGSGESMPRDFFVKVLVAIVVTPQEWPGATNLSQYPKSRFD